MTEDRDIISFMKRESLKALDRLVSAGILEHCTIDGKPAVQLTEKGKQIKAEDLL